MTRAIILACLAAALCVQAQAQSTNGDVHWFTDAPALSSGAQTGMQICTNGVEWDSDHLVCAPDAPLPQVPDATRGLDLAPQGVIIGEGSTLEEVPIPPPAFLENECGRPLTEQDVLHGLPACVKAPTPPEMRPIAPQDLPPSGAGGGGETIAGPKSCLGARPDGTYFPTPCEPAPLPSKEAGCVRGYGVTISDGTFVIGVADAAGQVVYPPNGMTIISGDAGALWWCPAGSLPR